MHSWTNNYFTSMFEQNQKYANIFGFLFNLENFVVSK